jgi:hypothetical protein
MNASKHNEGKGDVCLAEIKITRGYIQVSRGVYLLNTQNWTIGSWGMWVLENFYLLPRRVLEREKTSSFNAETIDWQMPIPKYLPAPILCNEKSSTKNGKFPVVISVVIRILVLLLFVAFILLLVTGAWVDKTIVSTFIFIFVCCFVCFQHLKSACCSYTLKIYDDFNNEYLFYDYSFEKLQKIYEDVKNAVESEQRRHNPVTNYNFTGGTYKNSAFGDGATVINEHTSIDVNINWSALECELVELENPHNLGGIEKFRADALACVKEKNATKLNKVLSGLEKTVVEIIAKTAGTVVAELVKPFVV